MPLSLPRFSASPQIQKMVLGFTIAYAVLVLFTSLLVWIQADSGWFATILLFSPRSIIATPLLLLIPAAILTRNKRSLLLDLALVFVMIPVLGIVVSLGPVLTSPDELSARIHIMTLNTDGKRIDPDTINQLLIDDKIDIALLQDVRSPTLTAKLPPGWSTASAFEGRLAVCSRFPVKRVGERGNSQFGAGRGAARFSVETSGIQWTLVNVHLPTPRNGLEAILGRNPEAISRLREVITQRDQASRMIREWVGEPEPNLFIAGDFNLPQESNIYRRDWSDFRDAFSVAGNGWGHTMYTRWVSVRIDHILYTPPWRCRSAWIGADIGADHRPLIAEFEFRAD